VAVGRYTYRHEAEFAAGFLRDAGIPYRLQIDDPVLGMSLSSPATLWVLEVDALRARAILEVEPPRSDAPALSARTATVSRGVTGAAPGRAAVPGEERRPRANLTLRERALALLGGGALLTAGRLFLPGAAGPIVAVVVVIGAAALVMFGMVGWAPRPVRRLLSVLSGAAP